jgi:hypothetical protein
MNSPNLGRLRTSEHDARASPAGCCSFLGPCPAVSWFRAFAEFYIGSWAGYSSNSRLWPWYDSDSRWLVPSLPYGANA